MSPIKGRSGKRGALEVRLNLGLFLNIYWQTSGGQRTRNVTFSGQNEADNEVEQGEERIQGA